MKKISLVIWMLIGMNLYGADKAKCEELFRGAIYNFYLENSCKYDKHLSSTLRKEFGDKGCTKLFSDEDMKKLNSDVLGDSYKKMKKVGRDNFCKKNRMKYDELVDNYQ